MAAVFPPHGGLLIVAEHRLLPVETTEVCRALEDVPP